MNKFNIFFIIFTIFFINVNFAKADVVPIPFYKKDIYINKKGHIVFPSDKQKKAIKEQEENTLIYRLPESELIKEVENLKKLNDGKGEHSFVFREGLAVKWENNKIGFIDTKDNWVIEPEYMAMCFSKSFTQPLTRTFRCYAQTYFSEGLAPVKYDEKLSVKINGKIYEAVLPESGLDLKSDYFQGKVLGEIKDNKFYITHNKDKSELKKYIWGFIFYNYKTGYIDKTGKIILKTNFKEIYPFSEGLALVKDKGMYGYIDKTGKTVIKPKYSSASFFKDGIAHVRIIILDPVLFKLSFIIILFLIFFVSIYKKKKN